MAKGFNITRVFFIVVCSFFVLFPALGQNATISGDNTICQGTSTNLTVTLTGVQPWKLTYTDGTNLMTVTGISSSPYTISVSPTSTTTYSLTDFSDANGIGTFSGVVVVTISQTPQVVPSTLAQILCNDGTTSVILASPSTFPSGVITFNYTVVATGGVTGFPTPVNGLPKNFIISDVLHNPTDFPQTVTYTIAPVSPTGCAPGPNKVVIITVNPTPRIYPIPGNTIQCDSLATNIGLRSPSVFTSGLITFKYTVTVTGPAGAVTGYATPVVGLPNNQIIGDKLINHTDNFQIVTYKVVPVSPIGCTDGPAQSNTVTVHARPLQSILVTKPLTCSGGAGLAALTAVKSNGADPYQIVWDGPSGYHQVGLESIYNLLSGKYIVKVTDNLGCNRKDSVSIVPVTARAYISADVIPPGNYNISCIGSTDGQILVSVTGGITPPYKYSVVRNETDTLYRGTFTNNLNLVDPTTFRYYNNLGAGSYTLVISDINGCVNINKIVFRVPPPIVVDIRKSSYAGSYNISCKGYNDGSAWVQTISGGRGGYTYRWYTTNGNIPGVINTNQIDKLIAGTYFLEIKDIVGCVTIASVDIIEPDGIQLSGSSDVKENEAGSVYGVTEVEGNTYHWTVLGGKITSGESTNSITVTWGTPGIGKVDITETATISGCTGTATKSVTITQLTGIREVQNDNGLSLSNYPNPFVGFTTIAYSLSSEGFITLTIRNLAGQVVKTFLNEMEPKGDYILNIETSNLQSGVYIVTLSLKNNTKETSETIKILKQ
jgi:hypothetical protein